MEIPSELIHQLRSAQSITVLTGAGVSAESGIPTFRDAQTGLWAKYDPHELATPEAFQENPRLVIEWYRWRMQLVRQSKPNPAHDALVQMEQHVPNFTLITQNVDGLHHQAGSHRVVELHGSIARLRCTNLRCSAGTKSWQDEELPTCSQCGALLRPDVVWFGEALPQVALQDALAASRGCDLFFSVGTSGVVEPAASLPYEALRAGAVVVEVNPILTPLSVHANFSFAQPAGVVLPGLISAAWG